MPWLHHCSYRFSAEQCVRQTQEYIVFTFLAQIQRLVYQDCSAHGCFGPTKFAINSMLAVLAGLVTATATAMQSALQLQLVWWTTLALLGPSSPGPPPVAFLPCTVLDHSLQLDPAQRPLLACRGQNCDLQHGVGRGAVWSYGRFTEAVWRPETQLMARWKVGRWWQQLSWRLTP